MQKDSEVVLLYNVGLQMQAQGRFFIAHKHFHCAIEKLFECQELMR
jgi:hypothetical protein